MSGQAYQFVVTISPDTYVDSSGQPHAGYHASAENTDGQLVTGGWSKQPGRAAQVAITKGIKEAQVERSS